jgi:menaquinone-dependent protoporphyrinogen oxidase
MKVLIIFGTVEGQTRKIGKFAADRLRKLGHEVSLVDAAEKFADVSLEGVDTVILAASVHERRHPKPFEVLLAAQSAELNALDTLLLSISLSAAFPEGLEEAMDYLVEMKMRTGIEPTAEALVAGAVKTGSYDYFASQVLRHVVLRGRDYDPSQGEHEFTDWDALAVTIDDFVGLERSDVRDKDQ